MRSEDCILIFLFVLIIKCVLIKGMVNCNFMFLCFFFGILRIVFNILVGRKINIERFL